MDPNAPTPPDGLPEAPTPPDGSPVAGAAAVAASVVSRIGGHPAVDAAQTGRPALDTDPARRTGSHRAQPPARPAGGNRARRSDVRDVAAEPTTGPAGLPSSSVERSPAGPVAGDRANVEQPGEAEQPAEHTAGHDMVDPAGATTRPRRSHRVAADATSAGERTGHRRARAGPTAPHDGHGHGHGPPTPAARRVRVVIACLLVPAAIATLAGLVLLYPFDGRPAPADGAGALPRVAAEVTATTQADCGNEPGDRGCVALTVVPEEGVLAGTPINVLTSAPQPGRAGTVVYAVGDPVELVWNGDPADPASYEVSDFQRDTPLLVLALVFAVAVVVLGRWRGFAALVALGLTAVVLIAFVLPAILAGRDPLAVAVVGACAIMFGVLYLTHGFSARTSTAVLGTLASLLLIGLLGVVFAAAARLTGLDEDTANLTIALGADVDARGLVLAGLVIGALGALDDVTVTQTSAVWELRAADPQARPAALFGAAMRIGRDHVASAVNTLVLAYAGAALPLLLLFAVAQRGLGDALTTQVIATEVVRTLVGSIGIVASVPLTTALAVMVSAGQGGR